MINRWGRAARNTWQGLSAAARHESSIREELIALALAIPASLILTPLYWKRLILIGVVILVLIVELLNTAIEKLADRVSTAIEPQIGQVKDMSSAAVGLTLILAAAAWLFALAERLGL